MENLLLSEWTGPYEGVPAFDKMKVDLVKPALRKGMEMHLSEIDKITGTDLLEVANEIFDPSLVSSLTYTAS